MPENRTQNVAPGARRRADQRAPRQAPPRQGQRSRTAVSAPVAPSLPSLSLQAKGGVEVFCRMGGPKGDGRPEKLLADLTVSYLAAEKHLNGESPKLQVCADPVTAISHLILRFEKRFRPKPPKMFGDMDYTIVEKNGRSMFALYKSCKNYEDTWNIVDTRRLMAGAAAHGPVMERLALSFLKALNKYLGIGTWYDGTLDYALDWARDRLFQADLGTAEEVEDAKDVQADIDSHLGGEAARMASRIAMASPLTPPDILNRLGRIRKAHPLKDAIRAGCMLMQEGFRILDFDRPELDPDFDEYHEGEPLSYWQQNTIIWEEDNAVTQSWQEWLDSNFQEYGLYYPVALWPLDPKRLRWNAGELERIAAWPGRLQRLFREINEATPPVYKDPAKRSLLVNILT